MVTGLVGKSCAGKDIAADYFASKGIAVVEVDALGTRPWRRMSTG